VTLMDRHKAADETAAGAGPAPAAAAEPVLESSTTIYVCTTCRGPGDPAEGPRQGEAFADETIMAAAGTGLTVKRVRCLSNCKRGLSAAVRRRDSWTYIFGDLDPATGARALIDGALLFAGASTDVMPWRGRPEPLKRGLVARVPPLTFQGDE
jgi:predicted metal-binding protein